MGHDASGFDRKRFGAYAALVLVLCACEPERQPARPPLAAEPGAAEPRAGGPAAPSSAACSAAGSSPTLPAQELPPPVAAMRERIAAAATACDLAALERLALDGGGGFSFSFGAPAGGPAEHWRRLERDGDDAPLATLVRVLRAPYATMPHGAGEPLYVWPSIFAAEAPAAEDWATLAGIYPADVVTRMREDSARFGIGYLGYRAGITASGDWIFYIAGD